METLEYTFRKTEKYIYNQILIKHEIAYSILFFSFEFLILLQNLNVKAQHSKF